MKFIKSLLSASLLLAAGVAGQDAEYVRGQDPQADAIRDMQTGMAGLQQAAKDPVLMAQMMQDLNVSYKDFPRKECWNPRIIVKCFKPFYLLSR